MTRDAKHFTSVVAACVALVLLVAATGVITRMPAPLTTAEKRLVGDWDQVGLPGEEIVSAMTFTADRAFHANDGQFVGQWSISSGQLRVKYWNGDWHEHWSIWQPRETWTRWRWSDESILDIRFLHDGERVELAERGKQPSGVLIRPQ